VETMRIQQRPGVLPCALALGLAAGLLITGCGNEEHANEPPTAELTSAPPDGSEASFRIDLAWNGTDPEERLDRFEYAIDPPPEFTEAEIAKGGAGILGEEIPGENGAPTVTRIRKVVDGQTVYFDWVHTTETGGTFTFSADRADSTGQDSLRAPTGRFHGMHAFYLRAVDAEGAASAPDKVAFTATTLAPESHINRPALTGEDTIWTVGNTLTFAWTGEDPDGGGEPPVRYLYQLIRITASWPALLDFDAGDFFTVPDAEWETTLDLTTPLLHPQTPGQYVFAVRAVDVAGAVEPFLEWGRNAFRCQAYANAGTPVLTVTEPHLATYTFTSTDWPPADGETLTGLRLHFTWQASADDYSSTIWGYSWGVDLTDPDDPSGWSAWGQNLTSPPQDLVFNTPGPHTVYVRAQDVGGAVTRGRIDLDVVAMNPDRDVLYVDDSFDDTYPRDGEQDAFWMARLLGSGLAAERIGEFATFGPNNDRDHFVPEPPALSEMARYRMLLWVNRGTGFDGLSGLTVAAGQMGLLRTYLDAGGMLWLEGRLNVAASILDVTGNRANLNYPKAMMPGQFPYDVLKLHTTKVNDDKGNVTKNNLFKVRPFPGRPAVYDSMSVDTSKQSPGLKGLGITLADAVFDPILAHQEPSFRGVVDSLYVYAATGNEVQASPSTFQNRLTALRWHDTAVPELHGRIQWFGFPLYYFKDAEAQETVNRSLDWFLGVPQAPAGARNRP